MMKNHFNRLIAKEVYMKIENRIGILIRQCATLLFGVWYVMGESAEC